MIPAAVVQFNVEQAVKQIDLCPEVEAICPFDGDVYVVDDGHLCWTCPVCGHQHEQDPADEIDDDEARD